MKPKILAVSVLAVMGGFALCIARAQSEKPAAGAANAPEVAKTIRAMADALGMARYTDIGGGGFPDLDVVNRIDFRGTGTTYAQGVAFKTDYHVQLAYRPAAMRVETTRTNPAGAKQHAIQTVSGDYAWDESVIGAGLEPGRGTATPEMGTHKERLLQRWVLPSGIVKAAAAAGDQTKVSRENGAEVLSFPLNGQLAGVTVQATLNAKNLITEVKTSAADPALNTETQYSNYADLGDYPTEVLFPGHIVRKQGGHAVLDIQVKPGAVDISPYLVFPVPASVKGTASASSQ